MPQAASGTKMNERWVVGVTPTASNCGRAKSVRCMGDGARACGRGDCASARAGTRKKTARWCAAPSQVKSRFTPQMTRKPNTQNRAPLMCLSGQPALKVRLAASSKRDGNEWAWVVNAASAAAAVWTERRCEVAGDAAQNARAVLRARFVALECQICAAHRATLSY